MNRWCGEDHSTTKHPGREESQARSDGRAAYNSHQAYLSNFFLFSESHYLLPTGGIEKRFPAMTAKEWVLVGRGKCLSPSILCEVEESWGAKEPSSPRKGLPLSGEEISAGSSWPTVWGQLRHENLIKSNGTLADMHVGGVGQGHSSFWRGPRVVPAELP